MYIKQTKTFEECVNINNPKLYHNKQVMITNSKRHRLWTILLTFVSFFINTHDTLASSSVYEKILNNIYDSETQSIDIKTENEKTKNFLTQLGNDGAFPDVDYSSKSQTYWQPYVHLKRMNSMVLSYIIPTSVYYGNESLYKSIIKMLQYWYDSNPSSTNWYNIDIGCPQLMGLNLSLLRNGAMKVPHEIENKILDRIKNVTKRPDYPGSPGTGANKMDIALQWIYRTCLQEDKKNLEFAIEQFFYPLKFNTGEGLQFDFSYQQHGPQLYTGGYGESVLTAFFKVALYLKGTCYENAEVNSLIGDFIRFGYLPAIRGSYMLYNSIGRGFARKGGTNRFHFVKSLDIMKKLDSKNMKIYDNAIKRINKTKDAGYGLQAMHRHYWRSDYTIHQRRGYTIDVRLASKRLYRCENGNGENLNGYFMTDGGSAIVRRGDEYSDIYPVWDWTRIPGTTTPVLSKVPQPRQWGTYGQTDFVGGVTDGVYGITTCELDNKEFGINTSAFKSWFFFDKEIVCTGSKIQSTNQHPINTTLNQCLCNGNIKISKENSSQEEILEKGRLMTSTQIRWVNHDGISYYFPEGGRINVQNKDQSGTWYSICSNIKDKKAVHKDVFKLWLDHGIQPSNRQYVYYIVPNTFSIKKANKSIDNIIYVNNDSVQAVYNRTLKIIGVVFLKPTLIQIKDIRIKVNKPCVVMLTNITSPKIRLFISDPSHALLSVNVCVNLPQFKSAKEIECKFKQDTHHKGSTHEFEISHSL